MSQSAVQSPGLLAELRRRRVFRTLALYILGAWVLMQVADVLFPAVGIPESAIGLLLIAAVIGFPVAAVFGWFFDITADGIRRTRKASAGDTVESSPLGAADYVLLAGLLGMIGVIVYGTFTGVVESPFDVGEEPVVEVDPSVPTIAVLPFAARGAGEDPGFFASGVHDDLLTQLTKVSGLRVISRTSVLEYAQTSKAIPEIGIELGASAIVEGGVQIAGGQIRINAQLIDAKTDAHLWAETFDRELTTNNIFTVQTDIARAIAAALKATLSDAEESALAIIPTENMAAYRSYHSAMREFESRVQGHRERAAALLEEAIQTDPNFTRAMAELIGTLSLRNFRKQDPEEVAYIESLIDRIAAIAPDSIDHLLAQGFYTYYIVKDYATADDLLTAALDRAPSETRLLEILSWIKKRNGDFEGWIEVTRIGRQLEPTNQRWTDSLVARLSLVHDYKGALKEARSVPDPSASIRANIAELELAEHHNVATYAEAMRTLSQAPRGEQTRSLLIRRIESQMLLRDFSAVQENLQLMRGFMPLPTPPARYLPPYITMSMLISHLSGNSEGLKRGLNEAYLLLGLSDSESGRQMEDLTLVDRWFLALVQEQRERIRELAVEFRAAIDDDLAQKVGQMETYCMGLGIAGEASLAVDCLREGIEDPSYVRPFLDPLLPFYDPIRETPEFKTLMDELREAGWIGDDA
ncbi:MAG: hypothetical protein Cons2KO_11420 [Congregibacter sp.]